MVTRRSLFAFLPCVGYAQRRRASGPRIGIINYSREIVDDALLRVLQRQVDEHLFPAWRIRAELFLADNGELLDTDYVLYVHPAGGPNAVLGDHFVDAAGRPTARVFADKLDADAPLSTVISHEVLEMLARPWGQALALDITPGTGGRQGALYKQEVCDPVEGTYYLIDGYPVSDFVLPAYYMPNSRGPWDYCGVLDGPFSNSATGRVSQRLVGDLGNWS